MFVGTGGRPCTEKKLSSEANKKKIYFVKRSSLRGKMRQLANCQVRHTQAGDKYLSEKKQSGCHNNKSSTYAGKAVFFLCSYFLWCLPERKFFFLF